LKFRNVIFTAICIIFFTAGISFSQQDSTAKKFVIINKDSVEIGKYYSFFLSDRSSMLGKIVTIKKNMLLIYSDGKLEEIDKIDIVAVEDARNVLYELSLSKKNIGRNKVYWFFGAGYLTLRGEEQRNTNQDHYGDGFSIHASSLTTVSHSFGFLVDIDYNFIPKKEYTQSEYSQFYGTYRYDHTGGTISGLLFKFNLALGSFDPANNINVYAFPGFGSGIYYHTAEIENTYHNGELINVYRNEGDKMHLALGASIGLGISIKYNSKVRFFAESQYNTWTWEPPSNYNFKAGVMLVIK
jgi:hypothetical protein